ncbi:MAG TPA: NAD(P)-binding protein [Opitutaceae bacterium]
MSSSSPKPTLDCELCIVGAGYAGLNGLNAAAKYLKKGARVVVIDRNETWGGQWLHQYDFVRLHQPHRLFTAGDQPWKRTHDPSYLATRREVLDHLATIPVISARDIEIVPLFRYRYAGHRIVEGRAEVDAVPVAGGADPGPGNGVRIRARRLLKAPGSDIQMLPPFAVSSTLVRSAAVSDPVLMSREFLDSDAPVYVIGSGKTAMDCVLHVLRNGSRRPRPLHIVIGGGMWFIRRETFFPPGSARFTSGMLTGHGFLRMAQLFDGQNEAEVMRAIEREGMAMSVFGEAGNCRIGLLSLSERDEIVAGVHSVHRGHLVDVDGARMILREGQSERSVPVAPGSWFINCTGHHRALPPEPVLQDGGIVCAPQLPLSFSGPSAYLVTHLWYRGELPAVANALFRTPIDIEPKLRYASHLALMLVANTITVGTRLPLSVLLSYQGDFNRWYPFYRQIPYLVRLAANRRGILEKAERFLGRYPGA